MAKNITVDSISEIGPLREKILRSAEKARLILMRLAASRSALDLLHDLKFEKAGFDPLDESRPLNFIEQLNQTFTYLATLQAVT